jgi:hypothetical protein
MKPVGDETEMTITCSVLNKVPDFHGAMAVFFAACPSPAALSYTSTGAQDNLSARTRHLCLALRLVNTRLSGTTAVSDETVIVVLVLGMYERQQGEYHRGRVHLDGLHRMVQMRGGVGEFAKVRPDLSRKIFRCVPVFNDP